MGKQKWKRDRFEKSDIESEKLGNYGSDGKRREKRQE